MRTKHRPSALTVLAWRWLSYRSTRRTPGASATELSRFDIPQHTRRLRGLRFSEALRDLFRGTWLRLKKSDQGPDR